MAADPELAWVDVVDGLEKRLRMDWLVCAR